uniref:Secreted protein n=1 Tax=Cucumis sativus TaxID=3659 RepID=A0A0A0L3J2_CUCSA
MMMLLLLLYIALVMPAKTLKTIQLLPCKTLARRSPSPSDVKFHLSPPRSIRRREASSVRTPLFVAISPLRRITVVSVQPSSIRQL